MTAWLPLLLLIVYSELDRQAGVPSAAPPSSPLSAGGAPAARHVRDVVRLGAFLALALQMLWSAAYVAARLTRGAHGHRSCSFGRSLQPNEVAAAACQCVLLAAMCGAASLQVAVYAYVFAAAP